MIGLTAGRCRPGPILHPWEAREPENSHWPKHQSPCSCNVHCKTAGPGWRGHRGCRHRSRGSEHGARCLNRRKPLLLRVGWSPCSSGFVDSGAQCQFECAIFVADVQTIILLVAHQANGHHQSVTTDFGYQSQFIFQGQAQELERPTLG